MGVTVLNSKPSVFEKCQALFGINWDNTIFAVDPHIHSKVDISDDIIEHELIHIQQQRDVGGKDNWWDRYFKNNSDRLAWEMEAYKHQYKFLLKKNTLNKAQLYDRVKYWASNLSGEGYGYLITQSEAIKQIMT